MAGFALFEAVLAFLHFPGTGVGFAMAIMPALILWYLNTAEVKAAFAEGEPATAAPAATAPEPVARTVAVAAPIAASAAVAARGGRSGTLRRRRVRRGTAAATARA